MVSSQQQSTTPARSTSPVSYSTPQPAPPSIESAMEDTHDGVEQDYGHQQETLLQATVESAQHVSSLKSFAEDKWQMRYPSQLGLAATGSSSSSSSRPRIGVSRTASGYFSQSHNGEFTPADADEPARPTHQRAFTTVEGHSGPTGQSSNTGLTDESSHPLSILAPDVKVGSHGASSAAVIEATAALGGKTLNQLLIRRLVASQSRLQVVGSRIKDTTSRILVSGDVNAGKSTFVNAVLRKPNLMPIDQQPMTEVFTEVLDAAENGGVVEIHAIKKDVVESGSYKATDKSSFDKFAIEDLQDIVTRGDEYAIVKVFIDDVSGGSDSNGESLLRNGMVSISLIDGPGLNRDTLSTTAVFARETEIDVIVFVVSAENHFTLSAKEFLFNASREKAYVFIVVNKWAGIRDKTRCARLVGEQIKQLSPATWESRNELVHYVDSEGVWKTDDQTDTESVDINDPAFQHLERSLRTFVLRKRARSKLAPAKHYMLNLLSDLMTLSEVNLKAALDDVDVVSDKLDVLRPAHDRLVRLRSQIEETIESAEDSTTQRIADYAARRADRALSHIAAGQVVPASFSADGQLQSTSGVVQGPTALPPFPGVWSVYEWMQDIHSAFVQSLESELETAEEYARSETKKSVRFIMDDVPRQFLSEEAERKNERSFNEAAMFVKARKARSKMFANGLGVGRGPAGLGLRTDYQLSVFDFVDLEHWWNMRHQVNVFGDAGKSKDLVDPTSALSMVSLGVGAVTMLGTRVLGVHNIVDTVSKTVSLLTSKRAERLIVPAAVITTGAFVALVVYDLPRAAPRKVGRKLVASLESASSSTRSPLSPSAAAPHVSFVTLFADGTSRESRKCLRFAGWDAREKYRSVEEKVGGERKDMEGRLTKAKEGGEWLEGFKEKVTETRERIEGVVGM